MDAVRQGRSGIWEEGCSKGPGMVTLRSAGSHAEGSTSARLGFSQSSNARASV